MNTTNAKDYLPLVQALAEGKTLQFCPTGSLEWSDLPQVDFVHPPHRYRVKTEPRVVWFLEPRDPPDQKAYGPFLAQADALNLKNTFQLNQLRCVRYQELL